MSGKLVQTIGLTSQKEYREFSRHLGIKYKIPCRPDTVYKEWQGWIDWLDTNKSPHKSPQEWLQVAEKLVVQYGGKLPNPNKLYASGFNGLMQCVQKYPELFLHIMWTTKSKNVEEHLKDAESLVEKHGTLPSHAWLKNNDKAALSKCMYTYPEKFAHIKQRKQSDFLMWHMEKAMELMKGDGSLPSNLAKVDKNLYQAIRNHPKFFSQLPRRWAIKRPNEWVAEAKRIATNNGGRLPNHSWLRRNGLSGLSSQLSKRPELFKGIKQEARN